jgi:hypothetical protein
MDYTYRIPGTTGPNITVRPGLFGSAAVLVNGHAVRPRGWNQKTYSIAVPDGSARELRLSSGPGGLRASVDGIETPLGPQPSMLEGVVAFLPIGLVGIGGMLGGVIAGLTVGVNMAIARSGSPMPVRLLGMLGATAIAAVVWFILAMTVRSLI